MHRCSRRERIVTLRRRVWAAYSAFIATVERGWQPLFVVAPPPDTKAMANIGHVLQVGVKPLSKFSKWRAQRLHPQPQLNDIEPSDAALSFAYDRLRFANQRSELLLGDTNVIT